MIKTFNKSVTMKSKTLHTLDVSELNLLARLISAFSDISLPGFNDGEEPLLPYDDVMRILGLPYELPDDCDDIGHIIQSSDVPKCIRNAELPERVAIALEEWYCSYYLPRIRTLPQVFAVWFNSLTEDEQDCLEAEVAKVGLDSSCVVRDGVLGQRNRIRQLDGRFTRSLDCVLRQHGLTI